MLRPAHNARRPSGDGQSNSKQTFRTKLLRREASSLFAPGMPTSPGRTTLTPNRMASRLAPRWNSPRASHISVFSGREADEALFLQDVQHLAQPHDIRGTVSTPTQRQSYSAFNGVEETLPERSPHEARQVVDELWSNRNSLPMSVEKQTFIERLSKNAVQRRDGNQRRSPRSWWTMLRNLFLAIHAFKSRNEMRNLPTGTTALVIQTHLQQWKRSKALEVEDVKACWIIDPSSWLRLFWDTSTALVLLIMVFYVPYHISFVGRSIQYQIFDIFVTIWFSVDILLSFITAYEKDGMLVTRPKRIAMHYAKGYLLVDLVATIPFDAIIYGNGRNQGDADFGRLSKAAKVPRLLRYIRAFKLIRVYGNQNMVQRAMVYAQLNPGILRLVQITVSTFVGAHLIACFWYSLGTYYLNKTLRPEDCTSSFEQYYHRERRSKKCTWLQASGYQEGDGHFFLYSVSLYWSFTVISTVGFGDYTPMNQYEMLFTCFVTVAGVAWYSLIISSVGKIFDARDKTSKLQWRTTVLNSFVHKYKVPSHLAAALHSHNRQHFELGHHWRNEDNEASKLIASLSRPLYRILALHLEAKLITKIPFFTGKPNAFVADAVVLSEQSLFPMVYAIHFVLRLHPKISVTGETILNTGSVANSLHFIICGSISIRSLEDCFPNELGRMKKGAYFGDEGCLLQAYFIGNLDASETVSLELIDKNNLCKLLDGFPNVQEDILKTAKCRLKYSGILAVRTMSRKRRTSTVEPSNSSQLHSPSDIMESTFTNSTRGAP